MALKIRLLGIALIACSLLLGWKALAMFGGGAHFGSPAHQVCSSITEPAELVASCGILRSHIRAMSMQYDDAQTLIRLAAIAALFLGAAALTIALEKPRRES